MTVDNTLKEWTTIVTELKKKKILGSRRKRVTVHKKLIRFKIINTVTTRESEPLL